MGIAVQGHPTRSAPRFPARLCLVLVSAALYTLAYPPIDQRPAALVAVAPFLLALRAASAYEAIALAVVWSLATMSVGITEWLVPAVVVYYQQSILTGVTLLVGTTLVGATLEYGAFALCYRRLSERFAPYANVLLTAAAWAAAELCRTRIGFGNPWGLFGYALVETGTDPSVWGTMTQIADLGGVYAVSFVLVAFNAGLAEIIVALRGRDTRNAGRMLLTCGAIVAGVLAYGGLRVREIAERRVDPVPVSIIQGNLDLGSQWREEMYGANLAEYLELTHRAVVESTPRVVFWPENAMTFFVDREPQYRKIVGATIGRLDVELVAGAPRFEGDGDYRYFNSVFLLRPDGDIVASYDKQRLLPFGEYFPFGMIDLLKRSFGRVREMTPGSASTPLPSRAGALGSIVCNEAMYPEDAVARVRDGAEVLVNLSNDSYVPGVEFAENQLRIATLRAIEQRRSLVRASTSGPSAIVDPTGRVVTRSAPHTAAVLAGSVLPSRELTLYARTGDAFAWSCLLVSVFAMFAARRE